MLAGLTASIVFYVTDITRTEAFWRDVLGIPLERMEGDEPRWMQGRIGNNLELMFFEMPGTVGNTPSLIFDLPDGGIDDIIATLVGHGVTIVTPVSEAPGGWSADFTDPDGFSLGLYQSADRPRSRR